MSRGSDGGWGGVILGGLLVAVLYGGSQLIGWLSSNDPVASSIPARELSDLAALCDEQDPKFFPDNAAYAGQGQHIIATFQRSTMPTAMLLPIATSGDAEVPKAWLPDTDRPEQVALVACVDEPDEGERVGVCSFDSPPVTFDLYRGHYDVTVYEAKTGREVTSVDEVRGEDQGGCPPLTSYREGESPEFYTNVDTTALRAALAPFVDGVRR